MPRKHMPDFLQGLWSSALSLCIINDQGFVEDANLAMCTTLGYSSQHLIGTDMMLLLAQGDASKTRTLRQQFLDKRYAIAQGVWQLRSASGCYLPLQVLGSWITKRQGKLFTLVVFVHEACIEEGSALLEQHILEDAQSNYSKHIISQPHRSTASASTDDQRLRQRIVMLEGQLSAYKAALERYKVPAGIHFEEGAWYIQLPEAGEAPTKTSANEDEIGMG